MDSTVIVMLVALVIGARYAATADRATEGKAQDEEILDDFNSASDNRIAGPDIGITRWGTWSEPIYCPSGIQGFKLRNEPLNSDNTALNGIQLLCTDGTKTAQIEGYWGNWDKNWTRCPPGQHVRGLAVRGVKPGGDDMGATNVKVKCSGGSTIEGTGFKKGDWTQVSSCLSKDICGLRAMIEKPIRGDDTALNRIQLYCCTGEVLCPKKADIGFLLDSSGSVGGHYQIEKDFIKKIVGAFELGQDKARASVITFSTIANTSIEFNQFYDKKSFGKAVDAIPFMSDMTRIDLALRLAKSTMFSVAHGARGNVPNTLILLTDGVQSSGPGAVDPAIIAEELRKNGVTIIAVGITPHVDLKELKKIAGNSKNLFNASTFNSLINDGFIKMVQAKACESKASTTPAPVIATSTVKPPECKRPAGGCRESYDRYKSVDCDGDGILDHVCSTTINKNRWLILSTEGCPNSWGTHLRPVSKCMKAFECKRPAGGCRESYDRYKSIDCDGDGILDHICSTTINKNRWLILSTEGCPNSWGTHMRPVSRCMKAFECKRPTGGCRESYDRYKSVDCDGDGILDHVCSTTINKNRWLILSTEGCPSSWGTHLRPVSKCMKAFECKRPTGGCRESYDRYKSVDCDGDGILDHVCSTTINKNRWLILSTEGCPNSWGTHMRPVSRCMKAFECRRPTGGCTASYDRYKSVDCDGDGILDHACSTTINNNRWLILSTEGCPSSWGTHLRPVSKCRKAFWRASYVLNRQNNCWWTCGGGPCNNICGGGGFCCRRGWSGCPSDMNAVALPHYHTCIRYRQGRASYVLNRQNNCWWTCGGGPCNNICGGGGFCCRRGWSGCPSDMNAVALPHYHTCIRYKG